jgi:hypothetical protein
MKTQESENPRDQNLTLGNFQAHADHTLNSMLTMYLHKIFVQAQSMLKSFMIEKYIFVALCQVYEKKIISASASFI